MARGTAAAETLGWVEAARRDNRYRNYRNSGLLEKRRYNESISLLMVEDVCLSS
jgi:hypothetical protein